MIVKSIIAEVILNSNQEKTIEVLLETERGNFSASAPSGISRGKYEAVSLPVEQALKSISQVIEPALKAERIASQKELDDILNKLDGTDNKEKLGANALLAVSIAGSRALSGEKEMPLYRYLSEQSKQPAAMPQPLVLLIEGGLHSRSGLSAQEFMIKITAETFEQSFNNSTAIYSELKKVLAGEELSVLTGCEGGFAPKLKNTEHALGLIVEAVEKAGFKGKAEIALDIAASQFFKKGKYQFEGREMSGEELGEFYQKLFKNYQIFSLEDPFSEEDWPSWREFSAKCLPVQILRSKNCGGREAQSAELLIVGDDLTATNPKRIKQAKEKNACQGVIIKPNQIGTVSEAIESALLAKGLGWKIIVSHRGGDTEDSFIADLAVGLGAEFIKTGGPFKKERKAKYDRLKEIEKELLSN